MFDLLHNVASDIGEWNKHQNVRYTVDFLFSLFYLLNSAILSFCFKYRKCRTIIIITYSSQLSENFKVLNI